MSGSVPTIPRPYKVILDTFHQNFVHAAHDLAVQVGSRDVHRWTIEARYRRKRWSVMAPLFAFAVAQRGRYEKFTFVHPGLATPLGVATGTPLVNGAGQSGRSLVTDGWTPNTSGIFLRGDLFKLDGHDKVHMLTQDADSDAGGNATLYFEPAMMASPADDEAMTVTSVPFTVSLVSDNLSLEMEAPLRAPLVSKFVERPE